MENTEKDRFPCPFPGCASAYTRKTRLREHLIKQQVVHDENHLAQAPEWQTEAVQVLLQTFTRPGNLTQDQRNARKKSSAQRCWNENRETYVENQRVKRDTVRELLDLTSQLKFMIMENTQVMSLLKGDTNGRPALKALYSQPPSINDWLPIHQNGINGALALDNTTFPRFVTYYLRPEVWPVFDIAFYDIEEDEDPPYLIKCLPGKPLFQRICFITHPDKCDKDMRNGSQALLTEAWKIWERVLRKNSSWKNTRIFDRNNWETWRELSPDHAEIVDLYWAWMSVVTEAQKQLMPSKVRLWDIERAFKAEDAGIDNHSQGEEEENSMDLEELMNRLRELNIPGPRKRKGQK